MLVRTIAVAASPRSGLPRRAYTAWAVPLRAGANAYLRQVYLDGRPVSAPLRAYLNGTGSGSFPPRHRAAAGYATVLPLRSHRRITGALAFLTARKPRPSQSRLYEGLARLASLVVELGDDALALIGNEERARKDAAALLHGTHAALIAIGHRLGESRKLLATDPPQADGMLESARIELERIGERDIGGTTTRLYPLIIRMSVVPALETLVERYRPNVGISLRVDAAVAEMDDPFQNQLPEALRLAVYRTAETLLASAAGREGARQVEATLTRPAGRALVLTVRSDAASPTSGDSGPARQTSAAARGAGLDGVLLRLVEWGGTLTATTGRDGRTIVSASFLIPAPDQTARTATPRSPG